MAVQGDGVELSQDRDMVHPGVQAVTHADVNQTVFPAYGYRGLGTIFSQGPKANATATAKD
jgi:hypothetical protein